MRKRKKGELSHNAIDPGESVILEERERKGKGPCPFFWGRKEKRRDAARSLTREE